MPARGLALFVGADAGERRRWASTVGRVFERVEWLSLEGTGAFDLGQVDRSAPVAIVWVVRGPVPAIDSSDAAPLYGLAKRVFEWHSAPSLSLVDADDAVSLQDWLTAFCADRLDRSALDSGEALLEQVWWRARACWSGTLHLRETPLASLQRLDAVCLVPIAGSWAIAAPAGHRIDLVVLRRCARRSVPFHLVSATQLSLQCHAKEGCAATERALGGLATDTSHALLVGAFTSPLRAAPDSWTDYLLRSDRLALPAPTAQPSLLACFVALADGEGGVALHQLHDPAAVIEPYALQARVHIVFPSVVERADDAPAAPPPLFVSLADCIAGEGAEEALPAAAPAPPSPTATNGSSPAPAVAPALERLPPPPWPSAVVRDHIAPRLASLQRAIVRHGRAQQGRTAPPRTASALLNTAVLRSVRPLKGVAAEDAVGARWRHWRARLAASAQPFASADAADGTPRAWTHPTDFLHGVAYAPHGYDGDPIARLPTPRDEWHSFVATARAPTEVAPAAVSAPPPPAPQRKLPGGHDENRRALRRFVRDHLKARGIGKADADFRDIFNFLYAHCRRHVDLKSAERISADVYGRLVGDFEKIARRLVAPLKASR